VMGRCEDEQMWRWEGVKMSRCEDERMWRWEDVKMSRCEDEMMWRWDVKMRRCFTDPHYWKNPALRRSREQKPRQIGFKGEIGRNIGEAMGIAKLKNSACKCAYSHYSQVASPGFFGWNITCCLLRHCLHTRMLQHVQTDFGLRATLAYQDQSRSSSPKGIASNMVKTMP